MVTLAVRGARLDQPATFVWDEIYYANDALDLVTHGVERSYVAHPPLAKWLIGLPLFFGHFTPLAWRLSSLLAGALVVWLVFTCTARLTRSSGAGAVAAVLVLTDGIAHFVGRYALLDGFTTLFTTATVVWLVFSSTKESRYWVACLAGALSGAALATKFSAAPIVVVATLVVGWRAARRGDVVRGAAMGAAVVGTAAAVYIGSFAPWIIGGGPSGNCTVPACSSSPVARLVRLPAMELSMLEFGSSLERIGDTRDRAWRWIAQDRPMDVRVARCDVARDGTCERDSTDTLKFVVRGNPVMWGLWPIVLVGWLVRRRRRSIASRGLGVVLLSTGALWLPWLVVPRSYLFYAAPLVPLLAIGVVVAAYEIVPPRTGLRLLTLAAAGGAIFFVVDRVVPPWMA